MSARIAMITACFALWASAVETAEAANCALRNPDRQIYEIFPTATNYRSVVSQVGIQLRPTIEKCLGGKLAFGDLGKHTVYIVFRDSVPLGFIHARSELGVHGSVELVWAMDLDMRIKDFRVQRSREKHTDTLRTEAFRRHLVGMNAQQLQSLMSDAKEVGAAAIAVPTEAQSIALLAVLSGSKTLIITNLAFRKATVQSRLLGHIHTAFPQTHKVTKIKEPINDKALAIMEQRIGSSERLIDPDSFTVLRSLAESGATLGALALLLPPAGSSDPEQWWKISNDGRILRVWMIGRTSNAGRIELDGFAGKNIGDVAKLANETGEVTAKYAVEVLAALAAAGIGQ